MSEPNQKRLLALGEKAAAFVKTRELVGTSFVVKRQNEGESQYGPSFYLQLGDGRVVGVAKTSAMGQQIDTMLAGHVPLGVALTVIERYSAKWDRPVYLLADPATAVNTANQEGA